MARYYLLINRLAFAWIDWELESHLPPDYLICDRFRICTPIHDFLSASWIMRCPELLEPAVLKSADLQGQGRR